MELPNWGTAVGAIFNKATQWIPSKKESKANTIDKLVRENEQLQKEFPLSTVSANRISINADRIKQLRQELERIS